MLQLLPMSESEFQSFLDKGIRDYAQGHVQAGRWSEEIALEKAQEEFHATIPQGLSTPDHYFFTLRNEQNQQVGILWFAVRQRGGQPQAHVYDIVIFEEFRRQGYATQAFHELEALAHKLGLSAIALHVFGHNTAARALYEKLGYAPTNITMVKQLA